MSKVSHSKPTSRENVPKKTDPLLKAAFEECFLDLLRFFYADADLLFDLEREFEFMDKELREIHPDRIKRGGTRLADLLVKVFLREGTAQCLLIHLEIQGKNSKIFPFRMFEYYYRLIDRFNVPVVAMAIFTGGKNQQLSNEYRFSLLGTEVAYRYKTYQIFEHSEQELLAMNNPFALVVMAAQKAFLENKVPEEVLGKERTIIVRAMLACKKYDPVRIVGFMNFLKNFIYVKDPEINRKFDTEVYELMEEKRIWEE